ncbi:EAL domain-containing protein [Amphritea balenae]|uniref:EAL domain-containing protein n=1 Tax=Amphritea balenae TaxID=452629 RepID=A0A3P1SS55_9GAMM|nr:EAL domain-containing protein [Amphritea balenae]GGK75293.1 hypothetical protein GCM10007941_26710 [Amphritea balenae]
MCGVLKYTIARQQLVKAVIFLSVTFIFLFLIIPSVVSADHKPEDRSLLIDFTVEEQRWLDQHPVLKMGIDKGFEPYEWIDEQGIYTGITADYIALLEQRLQVKIEPVTNKKSWGDVLKGARSGEFDLMSCLVETQERKNYLLFTEPYLSSVAVIISEQSKGYIGTLDKLRGKTVAIHKGHYTNELLKRDFPEITIANTTSLAAALKMVAEGEAVAFVGDATAASHMMKKLGILNLSFSGHTPYKSEFRIGVYNQHPELASIIKKALLSITKEERNAIYEHWRGLDVPLGIQPAELIKYLLIIAIIVAVILYWALRLRRSEKAHRLSELRFRNLVDATDGIVWESDVDSKCFTYVSDNAERLLGYSTQEWLAEDFWIQHIHPDDREWVILHCQEQILNQDDFVFEYRFINKHGATVWLRDMVSVVLSEGKPACLRGMFLEITEHKMAELLIRESEYRFRELIESLPAIAVQGYDEERRIIYWNDASAQLYGYSGQEAIGQKLETLFIPPEMSEQVIKEHYNWLHHDQPIPAAEMELMHKSGHRVPVFSSHVMLLSASGSKEMYCIDISLAEQKKAHRELNQMAHFDPLTQLPNRRTFYDRLSLQMKKSQRDGDKIAVMLLDLDHFKEVNDTLGHDHGDLLLKLASERLKRCVRETDTVARLGGDEFTIILGDLTDFTVIERVAQKILKLMGEPFNLNQDKAYISASIGITIYPDDADTIETLLKNADQAMYAAKSQGRNNYHYFTPVMEMAAQKRRLLVNDLRIALAEQQFCLYYQPIIDFSDGSLHKVEALIRWNHPGHGLVSPKDFILAAEDTGMIVDIGNWVFSEAIQQVAKWKANGQSIQVSINTSPVQFRSDDCDQDNWFAQLAAMRLDGSSVAVEITEGLLMEASTQVRDKLLGFRDAGVEVSLDDFGTGYSSLSYLKQFDIDYLKIDQSFVRNLDPSSSDLALCEAIIVMAHKLGIKVIAEGVETEQQKQLLIEAGCDFGQGYLFSKPVPAARFEQLFNPTLVNE